MRRCCLTALRQGFDNDLCSISRSGTFGRVSAKSPLITWGACIFVRGGRCLFSKSLTAGDTRVGAIGGQTICVRFGMCLCQNRRGSSVFLHTDADDNRILEVQHMLDCHHLGTTGKLAFSVVSRVYCMPSAFVFKQ